MVSDEWPVIETWGDTVAAHTFFSKINVMYGDMMLHTQIHINGGPVVVCSIIHGVKEAQTLQDVPELLESTVPKGRSASVSVGTVHSSASSPHVPPLPHGWHSLTAGVVTAAQK